VRRLRVGVSLCATVAAIGLLTSAGDAAHGVRGAAVSIDGERFLIDGKVTYPRTRIEGLLMNSRMVQAIFDDENPRTAQRWRYPDSGAWNPARNTREFVAALPRYAARGLRAVTVGLQGGNPVPGHAAMTQPWVVSAYRADGTMKQAWLERLDRVVRAAADNGIVVILTLFYFGQDERLADESAVLRAVDGVTDWVLAHRYRNVLIEIGNESDLAYDHSILRLARVAELVARVRDRSRGRLKTSTSFGGGVIPPDEVLRTADFVLVHGNGQSAPTLRRMIATIRGRKAFRLAPKPIVFNEDSTSIANLEAAVAAGASWGYFDKGLNDYRRGFQAVPVNWKINTPAKRRFFGRVAELARPGRDGARTG
jgi:hypothetical protein